MSERPDDRGRTVYLAVLAAMVTSVATTYGLRALEGPRAGAAPPPPGEASVLLPPLVGQEGEAVSAVVRELGLRVETTREAGGGAPGVVLRQSPAPWSRVPRDGVVTLVLSTGEVQVPALVGKTRAQAAEALQAAGLQVGAGTVDESGQGPPGTVVATEPPAGATVPAGTVVGLIVTADTPAVPALVGLSRAEAAAELEAAGLALGRVRRKYAPSRPEDSVVESVPPAGERIPRGTAVDIALAE